MTAVSRPHSGAAQNERVSPWRSLTALSLALFALSLIWSLVDDRSVNGALVWAKPAKFALSFAVLFATMELIAQRLSDPWRGGRALRITAAVMASAIIFEMAYMIFMAAQGQASHFNTSSAFHGVMYGLMGVGAVSLVAGIAVIGVAALRDGQADFGPALRWGIGWGALLGFGLTMITAGYMSSTGTHVGIHPAGGATLPLLGWSATVGDIRPAHFLALHAVQVLPLAGLWMDSRKIPVRWMPVAGAAYALLTLAIFAQALAGLPLIRL